MNTASTVAIMQPYLFPYIGYINLVAASDYFVFLDDVNYRKGGWINRNRVLINSEPHLFTVPLSNASQNRLIRDVCISQKSDFKEKFLRKLAHAYKKAPYFSQGMHYVKKVLDGQEDSISCLAADSIQEFCRMIGLDRLFFRSSELSPDTRGMEKSDRLISIAKRTGAGTYVNAYGGTELYDKGYFRENEVILTFVKPELHPYRQGTASKMVPGLSVIDMVMHLSLEEIHAQAFRYEVL